MNQKTLNWRKVEPSEAEVFNMGLIQSLKAANIPTTWKHFVPTLADKFLQLLARKPTPVPVLPASTDGGDSWGKSIVVRFLTTFQKMFINVKRPYAYAALPDFLPKRYQNQHFYYGGERQIAIAQKLFYPEREQNDDDVMYNSVILHNIYVSGLLDASPSESECDISRSD